MKTAVLTGLALAPVAGYLGTKASESFPAREDIVHPRSRPLRSAKDSGAGRHRVGPTAPWEKAAVAFHYGLAVSWAPTYALLRRRTQLGPVAAGLLSGQT